MKTPEEWYGLWHNKYQRIPPDKMPKHRRDELFISDIQKDAIASEREECAKIAESYKLEVNNPIYPKSTVLLVGKAIATEIRTRP